MDFSYSEDQRALIELAEQILKDNASHERLREIERGGGPRVDPGLWRKLAEAGLIGASLPEEHGGAGLGLLETAAIIEQVGRTTAPVPLLETVVFGALPIAAYGSDEQKRRLLAAVAAGELVMTAAFLEEGTTPEQPTTKARRTGSGYVLDGIKICVPYAVAADWIVVPARADSGEVVIALIEPSARGVALEALETTSGVPESTLTLRGVDVSAGNVLADGARAAEVLAWMLDRARAGQCALLLGVCEAALHMTAEYAKTREQFGQPIAMFQAVSHRLANAYVDLEAIRLTTMQAVWRLDAGLPAHAEVALAKYWASEAGQRVVHAAQHIHGGVGVDRDYPLHRYFLYAKQLELALGGATNQLLEIGRVLAATAEADA